MAQEFNRNGKSKKKPFKRRGPSDKPDQFQREKKDYKDSHSEPSEKHSRTFKKDAPSGKPGRFSKNEKSYTNSSPGLYAGENEKHRRPFKRKISSHKLSDERSEERKALFSEHSQYARKGKTPFQKKTGTGTGTDNTIRLNKYISNAGICSRREADELIKSGVFSVNGKIITEMGYKISPTDIVQYGGQTLRTEKLTYVLLNKPKDYITTVDDPQKRRTVLDLIKDACKERIYPVGRLDRATTGVLLFTNDGELTKTLTHPRYGVKKIYHVELDKSVKGSDLNKIKEGIELEDGFIKADEVSYVGDGANKKEIGIEIHSGKNRIVRRIFEHLGYEVKKLDRVYFAGLTKKDLPRGRWRILSEKEIGMLKMISGKS